MSLMTFPTCRPAIQHSPISSWCPEPKADPRGAPRAWVTPRGQAPRSLAARVAAGPASRSLFDMDTLAGRFRYYWDLTSSTTLLATRADIGRARHLMQCRRAAARAGTDDDARMTKAEFLAAAAYHGGGLGAADYARLDKEGVGSLPMALVRHQLPALEMANAWLNERLVAATTHPETSEYAFPPFRRSAFVAANIPIYLGMLMSPQTTGFIVFWQVFNQVRAPAPPFPVGSEGRAGRLRRSPPPFRVPRVLRRSGPLLSPIGWRLIAAAGEVA